MANPNASKPAQVVKAYLDTFFSKDVEKTLECLTDDVTWKVQGASDVPTIGVRHGKEEVRKWLGLFPENFKPLTFETDRFFEQDDECVVTGRLKYRTISTDKEFESEFAAICTVRDGKISSYKFLEDSYALWNSFQTK